MSKFLAKKRLNNTIDIPTSSDYIHVHSFNSESIEELKKEDLKTPYIVIVGTLTPPDGRLINGKEGYFYCSKENNMYGFINKELEDTKEMFRNIDSSYKNDIKELLRKRGIVLMDVIDEAWALKDSSDDDDIEKYVLDVNRFSQIDYSKVKRIIANSINAYLALKHISENIECVNLKKMFDDEKVLLIPQQTRGYHDNPNNLKYKHVYSSLEELTKAWSEALI